MTKTTKMELAELFISQGHPVGKVIETIGIKSSSFYYTPKSSTQKGKAKSKRTKIAGAGYVSNEQVIKEIEHLLEQEFVDYGYRKVTHWLRQHKKYIINEKKVYRLMKEHGLLRIRNRYKRFSPRIWVNDIVPNPNLCFEHLEFDIKYIWVEGKRKYALLLSVIDVKSRWILGQLMDWKIRKENVIELFDLIFDNYCLPKSMYVRNDNGAQFEAGMVQQYFADKNVTQEFTKPATPEQNAHIESYHSIIESVICRKYAFNDLYETQQTFNRFVLFYNYDRIHSGINYLSPWKYLITKNIQLTKNFETLYSLKCDFLNHKSG